MFGEGTRLLLTMSTTLIAKRGTQVFIDEIDTGLHHSVLADMWKMVIKTAEANDVQVFATTHSRDCIDGLAIALLDDESLIDKVSLHRVEQGRENTVVSHGESIITIGAQGIEVRG